MKMWVFKSSQCPETSSLNINTKDSWNLAIDLKKGLKQFTDIDVCAGKSNNFNSVA